MKNGKYDAIVLAQAGLNRLDLAAQVAEIFDPSQFLPAPGQGAILLQIREEDVVLSSQLKALNHQITHDQLICERAFLKELEGGCQLPCGIYTSIEGSKIFAQGALFAIETKEKVEEIQNGNVADSEQVGVLLARKILNSGGQKILEDIRRMRKKHD
jgi:hydroxymethylbilane synthase